MSTMGGWLWAWLAQAEGAADGAATAAGVTRSLFDFAPLVLMVAVVYMLVIRPSVRQRREHAAFLGGLKKDDEVATDGGICGRIVQLDERVATLEVADKVRIRILRGRIQGSWAVASAPPAPTAARRGASPGPAPSR